MAILSEQRVDTGHPLDPLSSDEIEMASAIVGEEQGLGPAARFVYVSLVEPPKDAVLAFAAGGSPPERLVKTVIRDRAARCTYEGVVSLDRRAMVSWDLIPGVQPSIMVEEFMAAEEAVRNDPRWQEAMHKRGITDLSLCMVDPWTDPNLEDGDGPEHGRFVRPLTWVRSSPEDNGYARPVDGVVARVDLDTMTVVDLTDHGAVPLPEHNANYSPEALADPANFPYVPAGPRTDVRSIEITQPDGASFDLDGHHLRWQKWDLRIGFTAREGLVLHMLSYTDGGRPRPIVYRASLSELFVPYGDPSPTQRRKMVLDEGECGLGLLANSLALGCDCLGEITYLDGVVNDNDGHAVVLPNAICLHEEDTGIAWKHTDFRTGAVQVRRGRRLVISSISTVGNYEYGFFWYLYTDGTIQYEVKLTGIISNGALTPGETPRHGTVVAPGVYGPHHQHFFNVRLDMMIDGPDNRIYEVNPAALPAGEGNPTGNAWIINEDLLGSEAQAQRQADPLHGRYWKVVNAGVKNELGQPVAYKLVSGDNVLPFFPAESPIARRGAFTTNHLWATAYQPGELFATGDYPNQSGGGEGLPSFVAGDRDLVDADLVVWYTFGVNHVARPEDWPVMPVSTAGFKLQPAGFFVGNPALDSPLPHHCHQ
jgi:primary-amine oxidase